MILSDELLRTRRDELLRMGYELPCYDREEIRTVTKGCPEWIHFGIGNIFRSFIAPLSQELLNKGEMRTGLIGAAGYDSSLISGIYKPYDDLTINAVLCHDGRIKKETVGSIVYTLNTQRGTEDWETLESFFCSPSLKMVSLTITEKGYNLKDPQGNYLASVEKDIQNGPEKAETYMGKIAALCLARFNAGKLPLALVSMDNISHNGEKLKTSILSIASEWLGKSYCGTDFIDYLRNDRFIAFPWSMIDKITPRPDPIVHEMLEKDGFENMAPMRTAHGSYAAPFVNAEEAQYLVIEDSFPNGRLPLDKAGVIFTDRNTVRLTEEMKVSTCLNPLHTALAVMGCLLGYDRISDEMKDDDLLKMIRIIGYKEGMPAVSDPGIIDPEKFLDEVISIRFPNPFLKDTPQRIATDTSQKISVRFGRTIEKYRNSETLDPRDLKMISLVIAAWCRYLTGIDDQGNAFVCSDDPLLEHLKKILAPVSIGEKCDVHPLLQPILSNRIIMGIDLYEAGIGAMVEAYFGKLIEKPGAVRAVLHEEVNRLS